MEKLQEKIVNALTDEVIYRDYDNEQMAEVEASLTEANQRKNQVEAAEAARQALLDKLGITADEAKLLLG